MTPTDLFLYLLALAGGVLAVGLALGALWLMRLAIIGWLR